MTAAAVRLRDAAALVDGWDVPWAPPLAELLRSEALHAADLDAASCSWSAYPADTALLVQVADGVLDHTEQATG